MHENCLRLLHENESAHFQILSNRAAESWNGNEKDIPYVESADEAAFARRLRCVRLFAKFTSDPNKVDVENCVFLGEPDLDEWLGSPEAGLVFWLAL